VGIQGLYGTAVPLARDLVLTADHVVANVLAIAPEIAIGWGSPGDTLEHGKPVPLALASVAARWPSADLAALRLPAPLEDPLAWDMSILPTLTAVASIGYPYGYDPENVTVGSRGFAGHIAGSRWLPNKPESYEVTFPAPVGLSGAPLLLRGEQIVCGVIVGNQQTMMLFSGEERVEEGGEKHRVERYETMNLGIAVCASAIMALRLPDGTSLLDFLLAGGAVVHNRP